MSGFYQDDHLFDEIDFEHNFFVQEEDNLTDCYLSADELSQFLAPSSEAWKDFLPSDNEAVITMDSARDIQWRMAKEEIQHVKQTLKVLLSVENVEDLNLRSICLFILGPNSKVGSFLREELDLDRKSYLELLSTYCTQVAYRASFTQLYNETSLLKEHIKMTEGDYIKVWRKMAEKKKRMTAVQTTRTSRREKPLWETLERIFNEILRGISISG